MKRLILLALCTLLIVTVLPPLGADAEAVSAPKLSQIQNDTHSKAIKNEGFIAGSSKNEASKVDFGEKLFGTILEDEKAWFTFTTGDNEDTEYNLTFVNATPDTSDLMCYLYDKNGNRLDKANASSSGTPATIRTDELEPNTAYYIQLYPQSPATVEYTLIIKSSDDSNASKQEDLRQTDETGSDSETGDLTAGSSQRDALLAPLGTKIFGTVGAENKSGHAWIAFTTGDATDAAYNVTFTCTSTDSYGITGYLCDEYGTTLEKGTADRTGTPVTISSNELEPNTIYYVHIKSYANEKSGFSVVIKDPDRTSKAYATSSTFSEAKVTTSEDDDIIAGTNIHGALFLAFETKVSGTLEFGEEGRGNAWFGFTTGENPDMTYTATFTDATPDTYGIRGYLYDEYGTLITKATAEGNGTPANLSSNELEPNTAYYIRLETYSNETADYTLVIKSPEEKKEKTLVFEKPFEINETQVQFVINEAIFIDEEKAKEVLKPVAEAILEYPDHSVLIAGTTATDMTQEECVDLSIRRAEAVKKLLIDTYNVPEDQLQIVGLGYERDPFERGKDRDANYNFVESEAKKNRRVVILDIEDPIAQELIKENQ